MTSERVGRRIESLLDEADAAAGQNDWQTVRARAAAVLAFDPENDDAHAYLAAAERGDSRPTDSRPPETVGYLEAIPSSFVNGRYTVVKFLGEGGKKKVYLAHDSLLDRDVAFALIKTEGLDDAGRERITREAQAMGRLGDHPNIVSVYDLGEESRQPYMVLPLLPGGDIEGMIEKAPEHRLPLERVLQIGIETCQGLEFAHAKGIVHRDLKPGNVWLAEDGRAQIGDFGLAVAVDRSRLTQAGVMVGTVSYMPPEQAMGGEVGPRSDLYSLGAMLYEMVCGRPPFVGDESVAIIGQHLNTPPVAPSWHRPDCPPGLEALILRLLEKDASKRPASAAEVQTALESLTLALSQGARGSESVSEPSPSGRGQGEGADPLYRRTFVGREHELKQLQAAFDAALSGQGSLAMVVGEPGIGKTSVCEQLATYAALRGGKALVGHCYEEGSLSLPYLPFVEAMRSYVLTRAPEGLRSDLGSGAGDVARIVSEVRDRVPGVELRPAGDPEDDRWRLLQSVSSFLRNAASVQPLFVLLEDLHDADRGTLDLLTHLSHNLQGARLLIVGTYRDVEVDRAHPLSTALAELRRQDSFLRVPLRGLTVDEVHRMYTAVRGQEVSWTQAEAVHRQTEGNPLFIQEVLRFLVEEGLVVRQGDRYVPQGEPGSGIPEGLRDVIGKRLSRLSDKANQLLSIAAVIGRDFRLDVLQKVASLPEVEIEAALEEASNRALVEARPGVGTLAFRFTHAFFRQTLYEETFASRRLRLHQQVARALEETYGRRVEEHAAELAEHFAQSTDSADLAKALHYSEVAAERARSVYAHGDVVRHLEQAVKIQEVLNPDDKTKRCDLLLRLCRALALAGEPQRVINEVAPAALAEAEALGDKLRAARACNAILGSIANLSGGAGIASPEFRRWAAMAVSYSPPDTVELAFAEIQYGRGLRLAGDRLAGWHRGLSALELARRLGDRYTIILAFSGLLQSLGLPGTEDDKLRLAGEFEGYDREGADSQGVLTGLLAAGATLLGSGARSQMEALWREGEAFSQRTNWPNARIFMLTSEIVLATLDGKLEAALDIGLRLEQRAIEGGIPVLGRRYRTNVIRNPLLYLGLPEVALEPLEEANSVAGLEGDSPGRAVQRALCLAHLGRRDEARDLVASFLQTRDVGDQNDTSPTWLLSDLLELAVMLEDRELAAKLILRLQNVAGLIPSGPNYFGTCIARHLGAGTALLGNCEHAKAYYATALELCGKMRNRPEIALTHLGLAELLLAYPEEHSAALEHLDFAIAEFRDMKMQPSLERALRHRELLKA